MSSGWRWLRSGWWLGLAALAIVALRSGTVRGADDAPAIPEGSHLIKIGPQAVVLVDEQGRAHMYDDPSQQTSACKSKLGCWGGALGAFAFFGLAGYEELTDGVERGAASMREFGPLN